MGAHTESEVDYITGSIWVLCGPSGPDPTRHPVRARADALVTLMGRNICLTFLVLQRQIKVGPATLQYDEDGGDHDDGCGETAERD